MVVTPKLSDEFYAQRWEQGNIPIKFRGIRLNQYSHPHQSGVVAKKAATEFVENFEDHYVSQKRAAAGIFPDDRNNIGRGLLLAGRNGTRKSTLANAILTEVQYRSPSYRVFYIRFSDWKKALTDTFTKEDTEEKAKGRKILKLVELSHLVVLDDIGQEHRTSSGFTESSLHELLRVRYEAARPTIVTTNVSLSEIADVYGTSFDSFRHDAFDPYVIVGPDTRKTEN
jgi:DNA replication protein DnaC